MERKVMLMKLSSNAAFALSMAIAIAMSDMHQKWVFSAMFILIIIKRLLKKPILSDVDEREAYLDHVSGWVSGILTLIAVNVFIISDVLKGGHFDHRLFSLIIVGGASRILVYLAMGGGRGKIGQQG